MDSPRSAVESAALGAVVSGIRQDARAPHSAERARHPAMTTEGKRILCGFLLGMAAGAAVVAAIVGNAMLF